MKFLALAVCLLLPHLEPGPCTASQRQILEESLGKDGLSLSALDVTAHCSRQECTWRWVKADRTGAREGRLVPMQGLACCGRDVVFGLYCLIFPTAPGPT